MASTTLKETIKLIESLSEEEKGQLLDWLLQQRTDSDLAAFSYLTSYSVLEKEWLTTEEDKAWESL